MFKTNIRRHWTLTEATYNIAKDYIKSHPHLLTKGLMRETGYSQTTISLIKRFATFKEYMDYNRRRMDIYPSRGLKFTANEVKTNPLEPKEIDIVGDKLRELEGTFETLKNQMADVISIAVQDGVDTRVSAINQELKELREFKESAIASNWVETVKNRFRSS